MQCSTASKKWHVKQVRIQKQVKLSSKSLGDCRRYAGSLGSTTAINKGEIVLRSQPKGETKGEMPKSIPEYS